MTNVVHHSTRKGSRSIKPCVVCGEPCRVRYSKDKKHKGYYKTCKVHANWNKIPGKFHPNATKGGRRINHQGYVQILKPGRNKTVKGSQYVLEHRYVVEQRLGRALKSNEVVHHANGIRQDNHDTNLIVISPNDKHESMTFIKALQKEILRLQQVIANYESTYQR